MKQWEIFLREQWQAFFGMSPINGGANGVAVDLTTAESSRRKFQTATLQFDDGMMAEWNEGQTTTIMMEALMGKFKRRTSPFSTIEEKEIIWARDSRSNYNGPAPGFLAFQKRARDDMTHILCMGMKREFSGMPDDSQLFTPTVLFVPQGQVPVTSEYPHIMTPPEEWRALEYMIARLHQVHTKHWFVWLGVALDNSQQFFRDPLEPHRHEEIKTVFGIE